jgi:hypothetical protein
VPSLSIFRISPECLTWARTDLSDLRPALEAIIMTLKMVEWLTGISLLGLTGRAIYIYMELRWRTRQIRVNDEWLALREWERKSGPTGNNQAA